MNNSSEITPTTSPQPARVLELKISGKIPSFKTGKRGTIAQTPDGKQYGRVVTSREDRARMKEIIRAITLQLLYASDPEAVILTEACRQRLIVWLGPFVGFDDSAKWIASIHLKIEQVNEGDEGAHIVITPDLTM